MLTDNTRFLAILAAGVMVCCIAARGDIIPVTEPVSLAAVYEDQLQVGDNIFHGFEYSGTTNGTSLPDTSGLTVVGVQNTESGDYGLKFSATFRTWPYEFIDAQLCFQVSVAPESDHSIDGVIVRLANAVALSTSSISVVESIYDASGEGASLLGNLSFSVEETSSDGATISAMVGFSPRKSIWVCQDLAMSGGNESFISKATVTEFVQFFSQVPEPTTAGLLVLGSLVLFARGWKR